MTIRPPGAMPVSDQNRFVRARDLSQAVTAALCAQINSEHDSSRRDALVQEAVQEQVFRRELAPDDVDLITRILAEYPTRIAAIRAGIER